MAKSLLNQDLKYSYRFLFIPETIGAITWLALNENKISNIKCGLVATCAGDNGCLTYKKTKNGNAGIDKIVEKVLMDSAEQYKVIDFFPLGSDERQFSSPAFNLEIGSLMRTLYGCFDEYHTSADNLNFISKEKLHGTLEKYLEVVFILENDGLYLNLNPKCEPQLGKRGLYNLLGAQKETSELKNAIFWILSFSNGKISLLDISIRSKINFKHIKKVADILLENKLLKALNEES